MRTLRRKQHVAPSDRTDERDAAADWIENNILKEDKWPVTYTQIAEESGWSRQHVANTIQHYFVEVDTDHEPRTGEVDSKFEAYRRGYSDGWQDGYDQASQSN